jgi:hypothetical protein
MPRATWGFVIAVGAACLAGCNASPGSIEPGATTIVLRGVAASPALTGSVELNVMVSDELFQQNTIDHDVPADGKLVVVGAQPLLFSGTYNTKTRMVRATGGGYTFSIDVPGGSFTGSFASQRDSGQMIGLNTGEMDSNDDFVRLPVGVETLCGTYQRTGDQGRVNLTASLTTGAVVGVTVNQAGQANRIDGTVDMLGKMIGTFDAPDGRSSLRATLNAGTVSGFVNGPTGYGSMMGSGC